MSQGELIPLRAPEPPPERSFLPGPVGDLAEEIDARIARVPTRLNEYGIDPFGFDPVYARRLLLPMAMVYRYWLRVETEGIENVPDGRVLLVANHAGNTFAWDGAMLATSLLLDREPPRMVRGMVEYFLTTLPFFSVFMQRCGSVVGTPTNCRALLEQEEAIMVFPEGERGFVKTWGQRYQLQRFGLGFMRLALETNTPIVPVGIAGSEEQSPGLARLSSVARLVGAPVVPVTLTFPWLGLAGFLPLPVKFRLHFGRAMRFEGDPTDDDAHVVAKVEKVKAAIRELVEAGRAERRGFFG